MTLKRALPALLAALLLAVPAAAMAQDPTDPEAENCDPAKTTRSMLRAADRALTPRNLLDRSASPIAIRGIEVCGPGRLDLRVRHNDRGDITVVWRARRTVDETGTYTLQLRMTRAGRQFVQRLRRRGTRRVRLGVRAIFAPPGTTVPSVGSAPAR